MIDTGAWIASGKTIAVKRIVCNVLMDISLQYGQVVHGSRLLTSEDLPDSENDT